MHGQTYIKLYNDARTNIHQIIQRCTDKHTSNYTTIHTQTYIKYTMMHGQTYIKLYNDTRTNIHQIIQRYTDKHTSNYTTIHTQTYIKLYNDVRTNIHQIIQRCTDKTYIKLYNDARTNIHQIIQRCTDKHTSNYTTMHGQTYIKLYNDTHTNIHQIIKCRVRKSSVHLCEKLSASYRKIRPRLPNRKKTISGLSTALVNQSASRNNDGEVYSAARLKTVLLHQYTAGKNSVEHR